MLFLSDFGQHIASPSHSLVFLGDACAEFNKPDSDVRRAKVEKKVTIKPFLRKGKMVKSFRRRQKVNQGKNGLRNKALIGLGLAAAIGVGGLATAKLVKKARVNKLAASARNAAKSQPKPVITQQNVVLVINAKHGDLLSKLKTTKGLTSKDTQELSRATQEIWSGDVADLPKTIKDNLSAKTGVTKPSEYDVFLVKLGLKKSVKGFEPGKTLLERLDAFKALIDNVDEISLSPRLSSKAYGDGSFYS